MASARSELNEISDDFALDTFSEDVWGGRSHSRRVTVEEVEDLIDAEYHVYTHESGAEQIGGCSEPHPTRYRTYAKWTR